MTTPRDHVPTRLRLSRDTLTLIDETIEKARAEFDDLEIDRQQVLELLLERRIETLKRDGGMEKTQFSLFRGRSVEEGSSSLGEPDRVRRNLIRCSGLCRAILPNYYCLLLAGQIKVLCADLQPGSTIEKSKRVSLKAHGVHSISIGVLERYAVDGNGYRGSSRTGNGKRSSCWSANSASRVIERDTLEDKRHVAHVDFGLATVRLERKVPVLTATTSIDSKRQEHSGHQQRDTHARQRNGGSRYVPEIHHRRYLPCPVRAGLPHNAPSGYSSGRCVMVTSPPPH